jgi:shikimate dehydrogenase
MQQVGLIGDPVEHSISPLFQQAAFDALGIAVQYQAWRTPAPALAERVAGLRGAGMLGANVTVPHKRAVMPLLDEVDEAALRTGAVNTIVNRDGRLAGYNTDIGGFVDALTLDGRLALTGLRATVLGAGGAARAVVWALLQSGVLRVQVLNRTEARARALAADLDGTRVVAGPLPSEPDPLARSLHGSELLVNCTSIGMLHGPDQGSSPVPAEAIPAGAFVADIVANPLETPLLRAAAAQGCRTLGGLTMLVRQGAASFELWTGRVPPLDVMFAVAHRAMGVG